MENSSRVKGLFEYLPDIIKFHKLKSEGLVRLIFVLVLFCQLIGVFIQDRLLSSLPGDDIAGFYSAFSTGNLNGIELSQPPEKILYQLLIVFGLTLLLKLISNLLLSVYMYSYILELKRKDSGFKASFKGYAKHIPALIAYNIIFALVVSMGSMFFLVPGLIAYVLFIPGFCYILDLKLPVGDALTASFEKSKTSLPSIIKLFVGFYLLFKLPIFVILSGNSLGYSYVASFFGTVIAFILQRLVCQVYMDLQYRSKNAQDISP